MIVTIDDARWEHVHTTIAEMQAKIDRLRMANTELLAAAKDALEILLDVESAEAIMIEGTWISLSCAVTNAENCT